MKTTSAIILLLSMAVISPVTAQKTALEYLKIVPQNPDSVCSCLKEVRQNYETAMSNLYNIVKAFSGVSPKEFITNRLMLEAQRKLFYSETSVKELAYELGFSDPDYFSKLFKKNTGKSVTQFVESIQDLSGK